MNLEIDRIDFYPTASLDDHRVLIAIHEGFQLLRWDNEITARGEMLDYRLASALPVSHDRQTTLPDVFSLSLEEATVALEAIECNAKYERDMQGEPVTPHARAADYVYPVLNKHVRSIQQAA